MSRYSGYSILPAIIEELGQLEITFVPCDQEVS
jgi:hypothetical protein